MQGGLGGRRQDGLFIIAPGLPWENGRYVRELQRPALGRLLGRRDLLLAQEAQSSRELGGITSGCAGTNLSARPPAPEVFVPRGRVASTRRDPLPAAHAPTGAEIDAKHNHLLPDHSAGTDHHRKRNASIFSLTKLCRSRHCTYGRLASVIQVLPQPVTQAAIHTPKVSTGITHEHRIARSLGHP